MKLIKQTRRIKCDVGGCRSLADYSVIKDGSNPRNQINLCKQCMQDMYALFAKEIIPESPANILGSKGKRSVKG